jgi:NAD(P)-dependent dehydrogenase (short-subunit alcohol dehydrogenase family)
MLETLRDRNVVITGASGGLGAAVTTVLLEAGATCHVPVRSARSAARVPGAGHERLRVATEVDLADEAAVRRFYEALPALWGSVHCAGGFAAAPVEEIAAADLQGMIGLNLTATFLCCREAVRALRRSGGGGRIVNVASQQALDPRRGAGMTAYTASKAAVAALTQALAEEVAPLGIWVNAVAPSILDTEANRAAMPGADFSRWPKVEEVAQVIAFLVSPGNRVARGAVVPVFGRA